MSLQAQLAEAHRKAAHYECLCKGINPPTYWVFEWQKAEREAAILERQLKAL